MWKFVSSHFIDFQKNISLTENQHSDALTKAKGIAKCLLQKYWPRIQSSDIDYVTILGGSYGKGTATRPVTDIDLLFILPSSVYTRFNDYEYNGQSSLLQEIKAVLEKSYWQTEMTANGQVLQVKYSSYQFEVVPVFKLNDGRFIYCDTGNGGSWKISSFFHELSMVNNADELSNGSYRALVKYLKAWRREHNVSFKSLALELAAQNFILQWLHITSSTAYGDIFFWHDWMVRDCFLFLSNLNWSSVRVPGTDEIVPIDNNWQRKAYKAYEIACQACNYESLDLGTEALECWKKIFGSQFPQQSCIPPLKNLRSMSIHGSYYLDQLYSKPFQTVLARAGETHNQPIQTKSPTSLPRRSMKTLSDVLSGGGSVKFNPYKTLLEGEY
ncbi:MAG: nucleotidyltransferase domain-containing protein [Candidatus Caenarcaniphilales bacterium]|nr:nucleotidyltransferase domain-containing protein [Candidatus Caenarcaniphilales bacterium]